MECKYCKMRLVGTEETYGLCVDCQIAKEDAENLNELNRYREMFPIPPWSNDPITPEVCERLGILLSVGQEMNWEYRSGHGLYVTICTTNDSDELDAAFVTVGLVEFRRMTAGQLAFLVAARKTDAKH